MPQEGTKKHTDTINRRSLRKYENIWEVEGKIKTQKIWETMGDHFICAYALVCIRAPSAMRGRIGCINTLSGVWVLAARFASLLGRPPR
eukprot:6781934-Pyramimonas_sp.AAC.1